MKQTFSEMNCRVLVFCVILNSFLGMSWSMLTLEPGMQEVVRYVNESYIVTCTNEGSATVGETLHPVTWSKGKMAAFNEKGHPHVTSMKNGTALVFERINTSDRGKYTCRAREQQISFELIVILPISFMDTASVQTVQEYRSGVIKCKVKGDPLPKFVWKYQGKDLNSTKYKYLPDGLKILNVSLADRGIYTCRAYQVSHQTSMFEEKSIHLNVQHKPVHKPVHAKVDQAYGYIGGEVNLTCEAIAEPAANFTWYRQHKRTIPGRILQEDHWSILQNFVPLEEPHTSSIKLFIHNESVFGDYLCKATNELGTLDQIISLQEGVKPPSPQKLKLRAASSDSLEVEIGGPDLNATKLPQNMIPSAIRIQYRIKGSGDKWTDVDLHKLDEDGGASYTLSGLVHNRRYEIRVATRNVAGLSDYTPSVYYQTLRLHADQVTSGTSSYTVNLLHVSLASLISLLATLL